MGCEGTYERSVSDLLGMLDLYVLSKGANEDWLILSGLYFLLFYFSINVNIIKNLFILVLSSFFIIYTY